MIDQNVIGRAELVDFPKQNIFGVTAKVDTGADSSSIWATTIKETEDGLSFALFGKSCDFYTGEKVVFAPGEYDTTRVANSFGHREVRYAVKLSIRVRGRLINGTFTLANRANKTYPILLGRKLIAGKFVVDVKQGTPLHEAEKAKRRRLREEKLAGKVKKD